MLRQILGLRRIRQGAINQVHHRLPVFLHQFLESTRVALLDEQHQGGIGIRNCGHAERTLAKPACATRLRRITLLNWSRPGFLRNFPLPQPTLARKVTGMDTNRAAEHLQVIRTLMERSALYRRALAPISLLTGVLGIMAAAVGWMLVIEAPRAFTGYWLTVGGACIIGAYLLARRQALKDAEPFWSSPTQRVTSALAPPLFVGLVAGLLSITCPGWDFLQPGALPAFWMILYGCALHSAGFFMTRGIKLVGWIFVLCGCSWMALRCFADVSMAIRSGHILMGAVFGGVHLAYGIYLRATEKGSPPT